MADGCKLYPHPHKASVRLPVCRHDNAAALLAVLLTVFSTIFSFEACCPTSVAEPILLRVLKRHALPAHHESLTSHAKG